MIPKKYTKFKYGDILSFRSSISNPTILNNPYEFNYKRYLNSKNIAGTFATYDASVIDVSTPNVLKKVVYNLREKIEVKLDYLMVQNEKELFKSMLYGNDKLLDEQIKENFRQSGVSHLLAVSGSNIAVFIMIISYISSKLNKKFSIIFLAFATYIFCAFSSFEISVIRASVFFVISNCFKKKVVNSNVYIILILSFVILEIYNPYIIFNVGLQMSYLSVISIIMFQSILFSFLDIKLKGVLKIKYKTPQGVIKIIYKITSQILQYFSLTFSVYILLFPLQVYYFNSFNIVSFLSNVLISFIDSLFSILGYISLLLVFVPYVSNILLNVVILILKVLIILTNYFANFDNLNIDFATPDILSVLLYYACIILLYNKKYVILYIKKQYRRYACFSIKIICFTSFIYICTSYIYLNYISNYVIYFNVEQGNMAFIKYKDTNIVVDIGSTKENLAENILLNFLKKKNIKKLDAIILTHFHTDHINGVGEKLLSTVDVKRIVYARPKEDTKEFYKTKNLLNNYNIAKLEVTKEDKLQLGKITVDVLSPDVNYKIRDKDVANANSIVGIIYVDGKNLVFMGDATSNTENYLLLSNAKIPDIFIYQVGHHGSKTSSSKEFIGKLNIKNAVISSKKKVYNHPSEETLKTLSLHNINIKITEKEGAIKFKL